MGHQFGNQSEVARASFKVLPGRWCHRGKLQMQFCRRMRVWCGFRDVLEQGWEPQGWGTGGWDCVAAAPESPSPSPVLPLPVPGFLFSVLELRRAWMKSGGPVWRGEECVLLPSHPSLCALCLTFRRLSHALQTRKEDFTHPQRKRMIKQSL